MCCGREINPASKERVAPTEFEPIYRPANRKLGIALNGNKLRLEFDVDLKQVRSLNKWDKSQEIEKEPKIRKNLLLAHQLQTLQDKGQVRSLKEASKWLNMSHVRIDQVMNMLLISPHIQEEILCSEKPNFEQIPEYKLRSVANEPDWQRQQEIWQELIKD